MNKVNWMLGNYSIMVHYLPDTLIDEKKSSISGGKYELKKLQIHLRKYWQLYLLLLPAFVYVLIFFLWTHVWNHYCFQGFQAEAGILGK